MKKFIAQLRATVKHTLAPLKHIAIASAPLAVGLVLVVPQAQAQVYGVNWPMQSNVIIFNATNYYTNYTTNVFTNPTQVPASPTSPLVLDLGYNQNISLQFAGQIRTNVGGQFPPALFTLQFGGSIDGSNFFPDPNLVLSGVNLTNMLGNVYGSGSSGATNSYTSNAFTLFTNFANVYQYRFLTLLSGSCTNTNTYITNCTLSYFSKTATPPLAGTSY
jgi:hypothetical protein